ncbi:Receptor-type guanylate cyclase gcy [Seminavis robusta]|uniref:guanylate cyclase n=1 Tax=Seminavis robusta TaxID=568900 RepID=A0A9N8HHH9_9STRA|nr:Receptor-type guanylate cyclase gcy [Seminavis robusta]|eukprot:Sro708_g190770.1 Receptor-type guanylate cyclase gcy (1193) ;mRNA; r:42035-45884
MYGLVFEKLESFVLENHGRDAWHAVKEHAHCAVADGQFLRRSHYADQELIDLVVAASELTGAAIPVILEAFGHYWYRQMHDADGHATLLQAQGKTLRTWLSCLNAMHDHIQKSFCSKANKDSNFHAPIFWCEDCLVEDTNSSNEGNEGSLLLHYYSMRGALLVPMVVGIVKELAASLFDLEIVMTQWAAQGEDDAEFTTWKVQAKDPKDAYKLTPRVTASPHQHTQLVVEKEGMLQGKCPFTGHSLSPEQDEDEEEDKPEDEEEEPVPEMTAEASILVVQPSNPCSSLPADCAVSLSHMQTLFPFHVLVNHDFIIQQVGCQLTPLLVDKRNQKTASEQQQQPTLLGKHIGQVLQISRPVLGSSWDWKALHKLADQHFFMVPKAAAACTTTTPNRTSSMTSNTTSSASKRAKPKSVHHRHLKKRVSMEGNTIKFKAAMVEIPLTTNNNNNQQQHLVMFSLAPDARSVRDLQSMGLTIPELPLHSSQRDAILLGEYIAQEMHRAHELDKLSKKLQMEKDLSNTLLYNMLPPTVANDLRTGNTIEPVQHDNVTLFFSDIVGFTTICAQVDPWDVIDMLNQLYSVMDHLAAKFNLYKVETIGDAYMCCSGLPEPDDLHAENIANFAIAVMECVKHVKSPVDDTSPINLRVGMHTGHCTAGVVGTLTPHYCLFGDMVNVTARHEQTGVPGRIQCSSDVFGQLKHFSSFEKEQYQWTPRGLVDMKGKGERYTYFLEGGTTDNTLAGPAAVQDLYEEVRILLETNTWRKRRYFRRSGALMNGVGNNSVVSGSDWMSDMSMSEAGGSNSRLPVSDSLTEDLTASAAGSNALLEPDETSNETGKADSLDTQSTRIDDLDLDLDIDEHLQGIDESNNDSNADVATKTDAKTAVVQNGLMSLVWNDDNVKREDYVAIAHQLISTVMMECLLHTGRGSLPDTTELLDGQLFGFVDCISKSYTARNAFHSFRRAIHQVAWANYLFEAIQKQNASKTSHRLVDDNPWYRLTLLLAALSVDCKHSGVSGEQLQAEGHMVYMLHGEDINCQVRYALAFAVNALEENYVDLFRELNRSIPNFLFLLRRYALSKSPLDQFEKVMAHDEDEADNATMERTGATAAVVLKVASWGHFALDGASFAAWNKAAMSEKRIASLAGRGPDPVPTWNDDCKKLADTELLPLIDSCERVLRQPTGLKDAVLRNLQSLQ